MKKQTNKVRSMSDMAKVASHFPTLPLLLKVSFLLLSRSEEETHSMLSSVVASRSLSSDSASLFVAAHTNQTKVGFRVVAGAGTAKKKRHLVWKTCLFS